MIGIESKHREYRKARTGVAPSQDPRGSVRSVIHSILTAVFFRCSSRGLSYPHIPFFSASKIHCNERWRAKEIWKISEELRNQEFLRPMMLTTPERMFSCAGNVVTKSIYSLSPEGVDYVSFWV